MKIDLIFREFQELLLNRYGNQVKIIHIRKEEIGEPEPGPFIEELDIPDFLRHNLLTKGIKRLYKFQWEAIKYILNGYNTVIASGTGTGKTEAFLIPLIVKGIDSSRNPNSLLLYPTKALARDQLKRINEITGFGYVTTAVYDGDTPRKERKKISSNPPHILISNPDMIHVGLVLSPAIRKMVRNIDYLVLDEMHSYEGAFGAHVRATIERVKIFRRKDLVFIGSSATIGNPKRHGEMLFGEKVKVVRGPIWRRGIAYHVMISAGYLSRWSVSASVAALLSRLGLRVLVFVDSQQMAEVIARIIRRGFNAEFHVHRAGLTPEERRSVEIKLSRGEIDGVVATPTLELGIDIGYLDAVVMVAPPPSYAKYIQRAGRAGRRGRTGYVFMILGDDPIDSYYEKNPEEYFTQDIPPVYIEPSNEEVLRIHALALLLQQGMVKKDLAKRISWKKAFDEVVDEGFAVSIPIGYFPVWRRARREFFKYMTIRGAGPQVAIHDENDKVIGFRELPMAVLDLHPYAIYLHGGKVYQSIMIDPGKRIARVRRLPDDTPLYTRPLYTTDLIDYDIVRERISTRGIPLAYARVTISINVEGYAVYSIFESNRPAAIEYLDRPVVYTYRTRALLLKYPYINEWDLMGNAEAFHAIEHTIISAARPVCGAGLGDLGGISYPSGDIVIYDSAVGGSGLASLLFDRFEKAEELAYKIMEDCRCDDGCPRCIYSPYCGNNNKILSRRKALYVLGRVISGKARIYEKPAKSRYGNPIA